MENQEFRQVKEKFITQWGTLGSEWGINRTMGQIHALLMVAVKPMSTQDIMDELHISRGNANTNLRDLLGWGLIHKVVYPADRKEYFEAEKDTWKIFCIVARERNRREIEPALDLLKESKEQLGNGRSAEEKEFLRQTKALAEFVEVSSGLMGKIARSEKNKVIPLLVKLFK